MAITRIGVGGAAAAYPAFLPKLETIPVFVITAVDASRLIVVPAGTGNPSALGPNSTLSQDANDRLIYGVDWSQFLSASVLIASQSYSIAGDGVLTKDSDTILAGSRVTALRLLGGTLGKRYRITNQIVTDELPPQTKEKSFWLRILNE